MHCRSAAVTYQSMISHPQKTPSPCVHHDCRALCPASLNLFLNLSVTLAFPPGFFRYHSGIFFFINGYYKIVITSLTLAGLIEVIKISSSWFEMLFEMGDQRGLGNWGNEKSRDWVIWFEEKVLVFSWVWNGWLWNIIISDVKRK